jgi:germination protein M
MNEARRVQGMLGVLFVAIAALAIAAGVWLRLTPAPPPEPPAPPREARIYIPKVNPQGELTYESKIVAVQDPHAAYLEVFEKLVREAGVFPKGARLLSATVQNGTLQLNFSPELTQNFEGGSDNEAALINAITSTAGSFPTVERVQILVNNKPIESLGGHIDLSQALPVSR